MNKQLTTILLCAIMMAGLSSCIKEVINGTGPEISEVRNTGSFNGIDLALGANVYYVQDTFYKVEVRAQQNVLREIVTEVNNNRLTIKLPLGVTLVSHSSISVYITAPAVSNFNVSGSGTIETTNDITVNNADLNVSGSGAIKIAGLVTDDIDARVSGSGLVEIRNGNTTGSSTNISGSGTIDMLGIKAKTLTAYTSGSGDAKVNVTDKIEAHISGSGKIYYKGDPTIDAHISGSGKIIHL